MLLLIWMLRNKIIACPSNKIYKKIKIEAQNVLRKLCESKVVTKKVNDTTEIQ